MSTHDRPASAMASATSGAMIEPLSRVAGSGSVDDGAHAEALVNAAHRISSVLLVCESVHEVAAHGFVVEGESEAGPRGDDEAAVDQLEGLVGQVVLPDPKGPTMS